MNLSSSEILRYICKSTFSVLHAIDSLISNFKRVAEGTWLDSFNYNKLSVIVEYSQFEVDAIVRIPSLSHKYVAKTNTTSFLLLQHFPKLTAKRALSI